MRKCSTHDLHSINIAIHAIRHARLLLPIELIPADTQAFLDADIGGYGDDVLELSLLDLGGHALHESLLLLGGHVFELLLHGGGIHGRYWTGWGLVGEWKVNCISRI